MNSTLKKYLEFFGAALLLLFIGIKILDKDVLIVKNWFSIRAIQISLGSIFFVLLLMYINTDRKDMGPNKLKALHRRLVTVTCLFFALLVWTIMSQPTTPVSVSLAGVAKTGDVVETQKIALKANEAIAETGMAFVHFKNEQKRTNDSLFKEMIAVNKTVTDLDADNQIRQNALIEKVGDIAVDSKKSFAELQEQLRQKSEAEASVRRESASAGFSMSSKHAIAGLLILVLLFSVVSIKFFPAFTTISVKARRWYIPIGILLIIGMLYYSETKQQVVSFLQKKNTVVKDSTEKKESTIIPAKKNDAPVQEPILSPPKTDQIKDSAQKEEASIPVVPKTIPRVASKKVVPRYSPPKNTGGKMKVHYTKPPC